MSEPSENSDFPPTLVLGLGNLLREDEGAGIHAVLHLESRYPEIPGVRCMDGGTGGMHLVTELEGLDQLLVVDATQLHEAPGTVRLYPETEMDRFVARRTGWNVHDVGLPDLMAAASLLPDGLPPRRALVAIQPYSFGWTDRPSGPVAAAMPRAADAIREQLIAWSPRAGKPEAAS
ncbi:MAG TPA: hydrogenase maturation protease [Gammaproteobacteria bacterium]|nr:hydrogenase maturation protease [Gammaproteobacteria bacterium]